MRILTRQEILEMLAYQKYEKEYYYISAQREGLFSNFIQRYKENNKENLSLEKQEVQQIFNFLRQYKEFDTVEDQIMAFADLFSGAETPIVAYSNDFWMLFTFKETNEAKEDWRKQNYYVSLNKIMNKNAIAFLKSMKDKDQFVHLTLYLQNNRKASNELFLYWLDLSSKVKNKEVYQNIPYYDFFKRNVECIISEKKRIKSVFKNTTQKIFLDKVIDAYINFGTEEAFVEIKKIQKEEINNTLFLQETQRKLKAIHKEQYSIPLVLNFNHAETKEDIIYIIKQHINPQALIIQHIAQEKEIKKLLSVLTYLIKSYFERHAIDVEGDWIEDFDLQQQTFKTLYEIKCIVKYDFQRKEVKPKLTEMTNSYRSFIEENKFYLLQVDLTNEVSKQDLIQYFTEYMEKLPFRKEMERMLESKDEYQPMKPKI